MITSKNTLNNKFVPTEEQRKGILKDIQGEIDIFIECYEKLIMFGETREIHDCFLLHARGLYDFLNTPLNKRRNKDAIVVDFIQKNIPLNDFPVSKKRLDQQLAHISYERLSPKQVDLFIFKNEIFKSIINGLTEFNDAADENYQLRCYLMK